MNITAKELSGVHIGETVTVETKRWGTHTGVITKIFRPDGNVSGVVLDHVTHVPTEHGMHNITIQEGQ